MTAVWHGVLCKKKLIRCKKKRIYIYIANWFSTPSLPRKEEEEAEEEDYDANDDDGEEKADDND